MAPRLDPSSAGDHGLEPLHAPERPHQLRDPRLQLFAHVQYPFARPASASADAPVDHFGIAASHIGPLAEQHPASGAEALQRVRADRYAAMICDLRMPGLSGIALSDQLQQAAPSLAGRILVASGDLSQPDTTVFLARTDAPALLKSYAAHDLLEALGRMCAWPAGGSTTTLTRQQEERHAVS